MSALSPEQHSSRHPPVMSSATEVLKVSITYTKQLWACECACVCVRVWQGREGGGGLQLTREIKSGSKKGMGFCTWLCYLGNIRLLCMHLFAIDVSCIKYSIPSHVCILTAPLWETCSYCQRKETAILILQQWPVFRTWPNWILLCLYFIL